MTITTGSNPKALWPGVKVWWGRDYESHPKYWMDLFDMETSQQAYEELVEVTGPSGDKARYEYDKSGFLKAIHHPAGGVTRIARDAVGNVLSVINPLGNKILTWNETGHAASGR